MKNIERIIGTYDSGNKGALLFITAGIHGNEPSGVYALQRVFEILEAEKPTIQGKVMGVVGNKEALKRQVRFIDEDLNRTWTAENIASAAKDSKEKKEMFEIIDILNEYPKNAFTKRYFLDCHTTSAASEPYISVQNVNDNDTWAHKFPTYIIRGFSDIVEGCIDHYKSRIGMTGFVFEGGQHDSPESIEHHEGIIWLALQHACGLNLDALKNYPEAAVTLENKRKNQKTFEMDYRHEIKKNDTFKMADGYVNFQKINEGDLLATHNGKQIYSKWNAHIFMPLYQSQGNDGFFVVRQVS